MEQISIKTTHFAPYLDEIYLMSYKGLKDIRIDFIKLRSKMCSFNASIGLLPLILIVSSNEDEL